MPDDTPSAERRIELKVRTPAAQYERFISRFPQHGSFQWFFNFALDEFLNELDKYPNNEEVIRNAFERYRPNAAR